jgi:ion channel
MPLTSFWQTDRSLTFLLAFLVLSIFLFYPLGELNVIGHLIIGVFFTAILISGVVTVARSKLVAVLAGGVVLVNLIVHWTQLAVSRPDLEWIDGITSIASIGLLVAVVLVQVFRDGTITLERIQGAIVVYLLLGLGWGFAYRLVQLNDPTSFQIAGGTPRDSPGFGGTLIYFSFTTLTTTGYGDITPAHPFARSLAILEALVGQLYPAILIARLVSLELHYRQQREAAKHESK